MVTLTKADLFYLDNDLKYHVIIFLLFLHVYLIKNFFILKTNYKTKT